MPQSRHSQGASHDDAVGSHVEAEDTGETKAKARLVVKGFTDPPDLTEIRSQSPTLSRLSRQLIFTAVCVAWFSLEKGRCEDSLSVW